MIRQYRKRNKITLKELSVRTQIPVTTVHWCERNEEKMSKSVKAILSYIRRERACKKICAEYSKPALIETKPRFWRWLRC